MMVMRKGETTPATAVDVAGDRVDPVTSGDVKAAWIVMAALFLALFLLV
jgi:hypothetical protein